jgi:hypothetical protein
MRTSHSLQIVAILLVAIGTGPLPGCSRRTKWEPPPGSAADTLSNGLPRTLLPKLRPWIQVWRYAIPGFEPDSLRPFRAVPFAFESGWAGAGRFAETVRTRALIEVLSPDSVHALDFDTYLDFDRAPDGGILAEREPDSRAVLADFRVDSAWVVEFCGTGCSHDGAYWIDSQRFVLSGATQTGDQLDGPLCPFLDVYALHSRMRTRWLGPVVDEARYARYAPAADSALAARLERARFGSGADSTAGTRVGFPAR